MKRTSRSMSIRLPRRLSLKVASLAKSRRVSQSEIVREAVEAFTVDASASAAELVRDLIGSVDLDGPTDLSSNPRRLAGYGE